MQPTSSEALRRLNTAAVLRSLRDDGPASRSDLARRTGLAKATIGTIVGDLAERAVLAEGESTSVGVGRPSRPVALSPGAVLGLGLEVNVDYVAASLVDLAGGVVLRRTARADVDPLAAVTALGREVLSGADGRAVGAVLAVPGLVGPDHATVAWAPNLGWESVRPGEVVAEALGVDVAVDNDANLAAVAESVHGAAAGERSSLYVTGTVGIGGGIVEDGRLVRGGGFAGEVGHMPIGDPGRRCGCGRDGCWEASVGLRAMVEAVGVDGAGTPVEIAGRAASLAARDAGAAAALGALGADLGHGLATLATVLDPAVVVLGGYLEVLSPWLLGPAAEVVERRLPASGRRRPALRPGALGIEAAAVGAAEQALTAVLEGRERV